MAVGKTKKSGKAQTGGKKGGGKKKIADIFLRKEWYDVRAPSQFKNRTAGKTFSNRTAGQKLASDNLKGRIFEINLGDLNGDEDKAYRKVLLRAEDVVGKNVLTNFFGMDLTTDKHRSLVRKWQTQIEAYVDVRTTDGYVLRLFAIGFTQRRPLQVKKTTYAKSSQRHNIRKKMVDIMTREASSCNLKDLVNKFIPESIATQIVKETQMIFPLTNVFIRKVRVVKTPKFDAYKLQELHAEDKGEKVVEPENK